MTIADDPDLVPGTRIVVQSLPPPLNGRSGKVVDFDRASQAYVVHVDGGNPRTLYRENLRILEDQSVPVVPVKRAAGGRPQSSSVAHTRTALPSQPPVHASQIKPGDQILLCVEQHQFALMEITGLRRVCKAEPHSFAIAAVLDDADVPSWMRKPVPQPARPRAPGTRSTIVGSFRIGDPVYAVWDQDGRWYPGRIREDVGSDKLEIEWFDKEALPSLYVFFFIDFFFYGIFFFRVRKSLVCKRTTFDDLRNRPNYLAALNLAARTPGLRGLKAQVTADDLEEEDQDTRETKLEEAKQRSAAASADLFAGGAGGVASGELSQDEWNVVIKAMKILNSRFNVDGLVSTKRGEIFHVPPKFPKPNEDGGENKPSYNNWDLDASNLLHAWLTEGQIVKNGSALVTLAPGSNGPSLVPRTSPSRAALEAALARAWPGRGLSLPRGPLDIFHPSSKQE